METNKQDLRKAINYSFRLLKERQRSEKELSSRLSQKKFSKSIITKTIVRLKELSYIDDKKFSKDWIRARLNKAFGPYRISLELNLKGIDKVTIESQLNEFFKEGIKEKILSELAQKKFAKLTKLSKDPMKVKKSLFNFLMRRGFSYEDIQDTISRLP